MFDDSFYSDPDVNITVTDCVVTKDVAAVKAQLWINGYEYFEATGSSKRDPRDDFNPEIAIKLATGRAIRQLGRDILSEGQTLVREADEKKKRQGAATEAAFRKKRRNALPEFDKSKVVMLR